MDPLTDFLAKKMHNAGLNDIREWIKGLGGKSVHLTVNTIRLNCWSVSSSTFVKHPPLAFSALFASGLIHVSVFIRAAYSRGMPYYEIRLSDKGKATMKAWKEGDPKLLPGAPA